MATLDQTNLSLLELAKRTNNGNIMTVAEVLNETQEWLRGAVWVEANQIGGHKISRRQSLPTGTWRKLNDGVAGESSATNQLTEVIGMLESYSTVDKALIDISPNPAQFRNQEDVAFVEGLGQSLSDAFIYGDTTTDPTKFDGLTPRISVTTSSYDIDTGGTGSDTTSIWVIQWGANKCHMIYPRGSAMGIEVRDLGEQTVAGNTSGTYYQALRTHFKIHCGFCVVDPRCLWRIHSIESSGSDNIFDEDDIITALNQLPFGGAGATILCNKTVKTQMDIVAKDKSNFAFNISEAFGRPTTNFWGVPVLVCDSILNTETAPT